MTGVGLRFKDPAVPAGDRVEVFIQPATVPKMHHLVDIIGARIVEKEQHDSYTRMVIEKGS